eukprot:350293-Hanusia_phi.AAC.1
MDLTAQQLSLSDAALQSALQANLDIAFQDSGSVQAAKIISITVNRASGRRLLQTAAGSVTMQTIIVFKTASDMVLDVGQLR